jgi:hypothetical protein
VPDPALPSEELDYLEEAETNAESEINWERRVVQRSLSERVQNRQLDRLPLAYVAVSSLADNGNPQAIPNAILRLAVIAPAILQIFWIPGGSIDELICALSPRTAQDDLHPA